MARKIKVRLGRRPKTAGTAKRRVLTVKVSDEEFTDFTRMAGAEKQPLSSWMIQPRRDQREKLKAEASKEKAQ